MLKFILMSFLLVCGGHNLASLRRGFFFLTTHKAKSDIIVPQTTQKRRLVLETSHDKREAAHTNRCCQSPAGERAHCDSVATEGPSAWLQGRKRMADLVRRSASVSGSERKYAAG